jgi:hypothetical protein
MKLFYFFVFLFILGCEHKPKCTYPLSIALGDLEIDARLNLWVDSLQKKEFISPYYFMVSSKIGVLIDKYCARNDSIRIKLNINEIDTLFFINPRVVSKVYLGQDPRKDYKSLLIQFTYRRDFQGYRVNEIMFDD